ncbi:hypothetical protein QEW_4690 [Clostridioides difficile CD160]|uniref:hypothetical protein n=1 Tax=unclassified Clostridioides TaxID=2635829 RepID=UPI00038C7BBF|nr:hypothetical protein QEW_4690 [Clostridioides difficile CD160]
MNNNVFSIKIPKWVQKSNPFYGERYNIMSHRKLLKVNNKKICLIELHKNQNREFNVAILVINNGVKGKVKIKKCINITDAISVFESSIEKKKKEGYI